MIKAVIDTTVFVSAFLKPIPGGVSFDLLRSAREGRFELYTSDEILQELRDALIAYERMRRRYRYTDSSVVEYCQSLKQFAKALRNVPEAPGVVARDPDDDMVVACALASAADYIVTRDKDLLSLGRHEGITMITPEAFLRVLRAQD